MAKLYLMRAALDMVNLARYAAEQRHSDPDRTAHCLVAESFGRNRMPKPFVIKTRLSNGELKGTLLAYTLVDDRRAQERRRSTPKVGAFGRDGSLDHRDRWSAGPVVRRAVHTFRGANQADQAQLEPRRRTRPNSEQDIYLESAEDSNRAETYCQWLSELMRRQGGLLAMPDTMAMTQFAMRRVRRQNSSKWTNGPDATVTGAATVVNPERMQLALAGGIGRHKGYGYGMLLIRPVGSYSHLNN